MSFQFSKSLPLPEEEGIFVSLSKYEPSRKPGKNTQSYCLPLREEFLKWQCLSAAGAL